jgi:hypothetical protein
MNSLQPVEPQALIQLLPPLFKEIANTIPEDLFLLHEDDLEKLTSSQKFSLIDRRLRQAFWTEHEKAIKLSRGIIIQNVYTGVCTKQHFYNKVLVDKARVAFILTPPQEYGVAIKEAHEFGWNLLRKMMEEAYEAWQTAKDPKLFEVVRKTVEMLDNREKGAVIKVVEQKNLNVNVAANDKQQEAPASIEDINARLKELEDQRKTIEV